jgi:diguanylate cyclase (GGDEF)-like protein
MLGLDHFKSLNDSWGRALGDRALSHFAELLRLVARAGDIVGRLGGEEFAAVLPDTALRQRSHSGAACSGALLKHR